MLELEARAEPSRLMSFLSPLLAVVLMLAGGVLVFSVLGKDPVEGFRIFFLNPVKDLYGVSELLLKATPLMLCAIGLAIGFRANVWNIGAEGQFMLGAVAATGVALYFGDSESALVLPARKSSPIRKAWASPSGLGCTAYCRWMPQALPSPSSC